ncbi:hypothetical protein ACF090_03385 [Streptomyces sp. NPDC014892]|uniref:hypothetical protein n=1 Tax=Streptomyces sp. NPDC014892 TaxID=3364930 RepID=UPI0036F7FB0D
MDTPAATLVVTTDQPHPSNWTGREAEPVLPSTVAAAVRLALREGRAPTVPGSAFQLDQSADFVPIHTRGGAELMSTITEDLRSRYGA